MKTRINQESKKENVVIIAIAVVVIFTLFINKTIAQPTYFNNYLENTMVEVEEEELAVEDWMLDVDLFSEKVGYINKDQFKYVDYVEQETELTLEAWMLNTSLFEEMVKDVYFPNDKLDFLAVEKEEELPLESWMVNTEEFLQITVLANK